MDPNSSSSKAHCQFICVILSLICYVLYEKQTWYYDLGNLGFSTPSLATFDALAFMVGKWVRSASIMNKDSQDVHVRTCHIKESSMRMVFHID